MYDCESISKTLGKAETGRKLGGTKTDGRIGNGVDLGDRDGVLQVGSSVASTTGSGASIASPTRGKHTYSGAHPAG